MPSSPDNFIFDLIGDERAKRPFVGYVSSKDKTAVSDLALVRGSQNVYKKLSGTIAVREGLKRRGDADATLAGVDASYEWTNSLGFTRVLRVCDGKLQVESDILTSGSYLWYDIATGYTLSRFVFDAWWNDTLKKDQLVFVNGDNSLNMWDGGIGVIASTTANTIVLAEAAATSGFNTTGGTVKINGNTYTYSGITSATLTGVTADPTGEANGSVVVTGVVNTATTPASDFVNDFIRVIGNRLHVGSYSSRLIYISAQDDYTDFTVPATRGSGDPEILTLDSLAKGIGVRLGQAHIFAGTSDLYLVSYQNITVGTTLTEQTKVEKKPLSALESALGHEFIDNVGDDLVWLTQDNQLKTFGTYRNLLQPVYPTLSLPVKTELSELSFTGGHLRAIGDSIYITAPASGIVAWYQQRVTVTPEGNVSTERIWQPPQILGISRVALIDGVVFGHSSSNPQLYQIFNTGQWHDDDPSDENLPYEAIMSLAYRGTRSALLSFDKVYYEGYMTQGTALNGSILYDYQGTTGSLSVEINSNASPANFVGYGQSGVSLGDASLGDNPLGDQVSTALDDQDTIPKFRAIRTLGQQNCFEYQLVVNSSAPDSRWEILCLGANATACEEKPNFLQR